MAKYQDAAPIILTALEEGSTQEDAARKAGIDKTTFYAWIKDKPNFSNLVKRAKEVGREKSLEAVERSLIDLAKGIEYEEVRTEYESVLNQQTGDYEPVIRKQVRTKKRIPPSAEAIKFFLTNRDPDLWKNRQEHDIKDLDLLKNLRVERVPSNRDKSMIVHSEDEVIS